MSENTFKPQRTITIEKVLTPLSVLIALVGLILVIVGPVASLLNTVAGEVNDAATEAGVGGGGFLPAEEDDEETASSDDLLARQLIPYTIIPDRPRDEVATYTVQPGDTLLAIANNFGITAETIVFANNHKLFGDVHMLQRGMELFILPTEGAYVRSYEDRTIAQIADKYGVEPEVIINSEFNDLEDASPNTTPPWGKWLVVPGGVGEAADLYKPVINETVNEETGQVVRSFMPNMAGSCAAGIQGSGGTGAFSNPLVNSVFTQGYYPGHSGIDLAAPVGTPVLASDAGVVIFSGWVSTSWGYGVLVVLDHGNGWTSYYAHLNATTVRCGQFVNRGGQVGTVGSTGNSSGPHLHFELRFNHVPDNPAGYIPVQ